MPRPRIDIGICSYRNPEKLRACLASVEQHSVLDWRCLIWHNMSADAEGEAAIRVAQEFEERNPDRFTLHPSAFNVGYAGAVAELQKRYVRSEPGWPPS